MALRIDTVAPGSQAEGLGLGPGDELLSVDGNAINDALDYQFYTDSPGFHLTARVGGAERSWEVARRPGEEFGCSFSTYLGDKKHSCANRCIFCFIDQLPPGMRRSLYFKDDDERLSFLQGNYVTLTNLSPSHIDRIIKMHISPINVSVHTTDPLLRVSMMKNRNAGRVLGYLDRLSDAGIEINAQLVLCRGINDGAQLDRTLSDLSRYGTLASVACVPAGVTAYRDGLPHIEPYDRESARGVISAIDAHRAEFLKTRGRATVYASDEFYLLAGREIPDAAFYGDFNQLENGVGMLALQRQQFMETLPLYDGDGRQRRVSIVTGQLAAPQLKELAGIAREKWPGVECLVYPIVNDFFGHNITVAGLVTGQDIIAQLKGKDLGETLLFPDSMLKFHTDVFLDDISQQQIEEALGVKMTKVDAGDGGCLLEAMIGETV